MIHRESAQEYHARPAVSASFCWDIVKPDGCPYQAWFDSCFNPERPPEEPNGDLDFGEIVHIAALQPNLLADRVEIIYADNYRSNKAKDARDEARAAGKIPLLDGTRRQRKSTTAGFGEVAIIRDALAKSDAAEWLFGQGESEVSFTWDYQPYTDILIRDSAQATRVEHSGPIACKARADRVVPGKLVDLKTAETASPAAFSRDMARYGHHLRAAWYLDGWGHLAPKDRAGSGDEYLFVVVAKTEPHLVSIFRLDDRSLEWGRRLYRRALSEIRRSRETGVWSGYGGEGEASTITMSLPTSVEYQLADMEARGEL